MKRWTPLMLTAAGFAAGWLDRPTDATVCFVGALVIAVLLPKRDGAQEGEG